MSNTKFRLLEDDTVDFDGKKLYRIESLKDFANVEIGDRGGYVENERNLSDDGDAWIYDDARVYDRARVCENARVFKDACVKGDAFVCGNAYVGGEALVDGYPLIHENAHITTKAHISGIARICGDAHVSGAARVYGNVRINGNAHVHGNAHICSDANLLVVSPIGSKGGVLTAFCDKKSNISVTRGCFVGTLEEFEHAVKEKHGDNKYAKEYRIAIELIKCKFANEKK